MQFRVLGPLEVTAAGRRLVFSRRRERWLLAVLLLHPGRTISTEQLVELLWESEAPPTARRALQSHVARVRAVLRGAVGDDAETALQGRHGGYVLATAAEQVDACRFRSLVALAGRTTDPEQRWSLLRSALDLWRGPVLDGDAAEGLRARWCADLDELRLAAAQSWAEAGLALHRTAEVATALARLTAEYPTSEGLADIQMRALHQAGRTADALAAFRRIRRRLAEELGLDPTPALRGLHEAILRGERPRTTGLSAEASPIQPAAAARPAITSGPAQLPLDIRGFTGRDGDLAALDVLLYGVDDDGPTAVVISAVSGTPGVGKTALAVHWSHRARHRFSDGQLYVNLRGFDPTGAMMPPEEALRGFLEALGVAPERVPAGLAGQAAMYRSLLADKRMLVLLDNARDAEQVRPLLPGTAGCFALITSRNRLTGLVAAEGAHPLTLNPMSRRESRRLLTSRLGPARPADQPDAVEEIVTACAGLPLALAVLAARAMTDPNLPLDRIAAELRDDESRLETLAGGDARTDVRAVFSWSYRTLSAPAARLFRLLALHPGPSFGRAAASSLVGLPPDRAASLLVELEHANLLLERVPGRYTLHDLLRAYATELIHSTDTNADRQAATHRLLDHYLHTAHAAALLFHPTRKPLRLTGPRPGTTVTTLTDHAQALAWFADERPVLLAAVAHAGTNGFDSHAWRLAWTLTNVLNWRGHWPDLLTVHRHALAAARRADEPVGSGHAHQGLGLAKLRLGELVEAHRHFAWAISLFSDVGDATRVASTYLDLARVSGRQGRYRQAITEAQRCIDLLPAGRDEHFRARAVNNIGWYYAQLGDYQRALRQCERALVLHDPLNDRLGQAGAWDSLGYVLHRLNRHDEAVTAYQQALALYRESGDHYNEADVLTHLGDAAAASDDSDAAQAAWRQALDILDLLGHPDREALRSRLVSAVAQPPAKPAASP
jgi:DNA-binding SARP family transcriptional activator/Tfp pilus assembly protein PilF